MGFFGSTAKRTDKGPSIDLLHQLECKACPLNKLTGNRHPHMEPTGSTKPLVYVLGEAPGENEDFQGEQFVGKSGQLLRKRIPKDILKHTRFNNVVRTRPPDNDTPEKIAIECCRPSVEQDIAKYKPKIILGFGNVPLQWVSGYNGVMEWRGRKMPVEIAGHSCWYYPMLHPAFLLRNRREWGPSEEERAFQFDMRKAFEELRDLPVPEVHDRRVAEYGVSIYTGETRQIEQVRQEFAWAKRQHEVGYDYETNKTRPYGRGARILSVGIGTKEHSFSVALHHSRARWSIGELGEIEDMLKDFLAAPVRKYVHNLAFELEWTAYRYGEKLLRASPWDCTLVQASTLNENTGRDREGRKKKNKDGGPLSLNFLCQQHFGFKIKDLSKVDRKNLDNEPIEKVLLYNGMDSKYHCQLGQVQRELLEREGLTKVYERGLRRVPTCVLTQLKGVPVSRKQTIKLFENYTGVIKELEKEIKKLPEVNAFKSKYKEDFSLSSKDHVAHLLQHILHRNEGIIKVGDKTKYTTEKSVLEKIDIPFTKLLLKYRDYTHRVSTYLYFREEDILPWMDINPSVWSDGLIHAIFNSGPFTETYRLSSEDPNLQNQPKRNEGNREIRRQIVAPRGYVIVAIDYGQIEWRVIAMASKAKRLIKALWERYDVHMDWAERVGHAYPKRVGGKQFLKDKSVMKTFRTDIKNQWTFPLCFGATRASISSYLNIPEEALIKIHKEFQNEFSEVFDWQEKILQFYRDYGYVENLLKRRRRAPLGKNEIINTPIQGTAAEIVMDGMNRLSEYAMESGDNNYQPIMQIHDDLTFIFPEDNVDVYLDKTINEMLSVPFKFVNVPITAEASMGSNLLKMNAIVDASSDGKWEWKV